MEIDLDRSPTGPELVEPEDCKAFKVVIRGDDYHRAREVLRPVGNLESADAAWISVASLREMAEGRVSPSWSADFAAMLAYALAKGWLDETGEHVRGHCEWPAGRPT